MDKGSRTLKEQDIMITDGIGIPKMRILVETTNTMAKAINEEEFEQIMLIYGMAANRLLAQQNSK